MTTVHPAQPTETPILDALAMIGDTLAEALDTLRDLAQPTEVTR